jgi:hypothetical protein
VDENAALSQEQPIIPQAEAEHVAQPDSVADDRSGDPVAASSRQSRRLRGYGHTWLP